MILAFIRMGSRYFIGIIYHFLFVWEIQITHPFVYTPHFRNKWLMLNEIDQHKYIKFCHIFGICTQSTNPLFCFAQYFLSLYFSLKNAMVYIKKIKVKTTLVYVFQKYMVNNEKLQQQVISSSIYTSLFLNSDLYVHSIMWGKSFRLEYYYLAGFQYLWLTNISVIIDAVSGFFSGIDIFFINR